MTEPNIKPGTIQDIGDISDKRNTIDTGIKRKSNNIVKAIFASVAAVILFSGIALTLFNFDNNKSETVVKHDEALNSVNVYDRNSLASQMEAIKKQQEEEARKKLEYEKQEKLRKEQEAKDQELARQEEQRLLQITLGNKSTLSDSNNDGNVDPLMNVEKRRFLGDTLVILDSSKISPENGKNNDNDGSLNDMLSSGVYHPGAAKILINRNLLLIHGTQIPCALQTRLITDQPSILICQITKDIFSSDGSTLLIERGSKVFGEQKKAIITGQNMAFVNWSEIETPHGVRIRIDSLGTDSLGASGINVWVDEKWGRRFGGAIILSFIQDVLATASSAADNRNSDTVIYENSERNSGRMAEIALENSINIQPTGYANQGQLINILVARDIDFSDIYSLK